ncbi:DUF6550 family protein (plasmid) [Oscillospiraceae bacterium MB08-C2-2]|nr:DUF6550 family protein [Oscillospiraceae bacterium MB08-C2-2]
MLSRKSKAALGALAAAMVAITAYCWNHIIRGMEADKAYLTEQEASRSSAAEAAEANTQTSASSPNESSYVIPPIKISGNNSGSADSENGKVALETENRSATGQNTGDVSKPEAPPKPEIPDDQKIDPTKPPEYTPEQIRPNDPDAGKDSGSSTPGNGNQDSDKDNGGNNQKPDSGSSKPSGPETNDKGQVWVPGFGWVTPSQGKGEAAEDMYQNGIKVGIM